MKRPTLDYEDKQFMAEARGFSFSGGYNDIYPAIDRRTIYGDEVRVSPMEMVTAEGSSMPQMKMNMPSLSLDSDHEIVPNNYHVFKEQQQVE